MRLETFSFITITNFNSVLSDLPFLFWAQCHVEVHLLGAGVVAVVAVAAAAAAVVVVVDDDGVAADAGDDCLVIAAS